MCGSIPGVGSYFARCLGKWAPLGLGEETPRRGVQHRALLCMLASRGAELFYHSPTPALQTRTLAKAARGAKQQSNQQRYRLSSACQLRSSSPASYRHEPQRWWPRPGRIGTAYCHTHRTQVLFSNRDAHQRSPGQLYGKPTCLTESKTTTTATVPPRPRLHKSLGADAAAPLELLKTDRGLRGARGRRADRASICRPEPEPGDPGPERPEPRGCYWFR